MPRVCLTEAQRAAARYKDRINRLADGLTVYKRRSGKTNQDIARATGVGTVAIGRLMAGDTTVRMPLEAYWRLEEMAKVKEDPA